MAPSSTHVEPRTEARPPVSAARLAANRANAAKSTGPRTPEGKARASMNAVTHGLTADEIVLPGEDEEEWAALCEQFDADLRARGATERELVTRVCILSWRLRRIA